MCSSARRGAVAKSRWSMNYWLLWVIKQGGFSNTGWLCFAVAHARCRPHTASLSALIPPQPSATILMSLFLCVSWHDSTSSRFLFLLFAFVWNKAWQSVRGWNKYRLTSEYLWKVTICTAARASLLRRDGATVMAPSQGLLCTCAQQTHDNKMIPGAKRTKLKAWTRSSSLSLWDSNFGGL